MRDQSTRPHSAYNPPARRHTPPLGYAPPPGTGSDYVHHPLHRVYSRKLGWVRTRWFLGGLLLGSGIAFLAMVVLSALVYTRIPPVNQFMSGEPDLTVALSESYLNKEAAARIAGGYDTGVPGLTLKAARIDLGPENRMDFETEFNFQAPLIQVDLTAAVKNQVTAQEGKVAVTMVGDPQIGNLNVPLDLLPAEVKDGIKQAVDRVNNTILSSELNQPLEAATGGGAVSVQSVTTTDTQLVINLKQP
jgi:hypothetical protein